MQPPIFVINRETDIERRAAAERELRRVGLSACFVPGVDGHALRPEDLARYDSHRCRSVYGVDMLPGELGCYLAHESIFRRIVGEDLDVAVILEDDCVLADDFGTVLDALLAGPRTWQVARLMSTRPAKIARHIANRVPEVPLGGRHGLYRLNTHVLGAVGYVMTQAGARRMLDYGRRIFMPIDHTMDRYWENGLTPYLVYPFLVSHRDEVPSAIGDRNPKRRYATGTRQLWRRRLNRLWDGIGKRLYSLGLRPLGAG